MILHCARVQEGLSSVLIRPPAWRRDAAFPERPCVARAKEDRPICAVLFPRLLDQFRHQSRPSRLVTRADAGSIVSMEVFIEGDRIPPERIVVELSVPPKTGRRPVSVTEKNVGQPS